MLVAMSSRATYSTRERSSGYWFHHPLALRRSRSVLARLNNRSTAFGSVTPYSSHRILMSGSRNGTHPRSILATLAAVADSASAACGWVRPARARSLSSSPPNLRARTVDTRVPRVNWPVDTSGHLLIVASVRFTGATAQAKLETYFPGTACAQGEHITTFGTRSLTWRNQLAEVHRAARTAEPPRLPAP